MLTSYYYRLWYFLTLFFFLHQIAMYEAREAAWEDRVAQGEIPQAAAYKIREMRTVKHYFCCYVD